MHHPWNLTPKEAVKLQRKLRDEIALAPLPRTPKTIAGADVSMNLYSNVLYAGFVVLSYPDLILIEQSIIEATTTFPYIPGLLSFREIPALLEAWGCLMTKPDVVLVDGVGVAHPRRMGIASHLGLMIKTPTVGCAKSVLIGTYDEPGDAPGSLSYMFDMTHAEMIGAALRTKKRAKPMFISPGYKITLDDSLSIVKTSLRGYRLPEPTRRAHEAVNAFRRSRG